MWREWRKEEPSIIASGEEKHSKIKREDKKRPKTIKTKVCQNDTVSSHCIYLSIFYFFLSQSNHHQDMR